MMVPATDSEEEETEEEEATEEKGSVESMSDEESEVSEFEEDDNVDKNTCDVRWRIMLARDHFDAHFENH